MADIVYGVSVEYMSSGNLSLPSSVKDLEKNFGKSLFGGIGKAAGMFGGLMDSIAGAAIGVASSAAMGIGAALAGGLAAATHQAIEFNKEMEDTQTGLATIANAGAGLNGFATSSEAFGNQFRLAGDVIKQMRKDAQELPGEFKDLQNIMALMSPAAENAGIGMFDTEKMAAKGMAAAAALRVPFATAGREMGNILAGTVTGRMPMFSKMGLGDAKDWNKLSQEDRVSKFRAKLGEMEPGLASVQKNWSTISSNFIDNLKIGVGVVGGPLLDRVKSAMDHFNKSDKSGLAGLGQRIGEGLVNGFDKAQAFLEHWIPIGEEFVGVLERGITRVFGGLSSVFDIILPRIESFMKDPAAFTKIENLLGQFLAIRLGVGVLGAGSSIAPGLIKGASGLAGGGAAGAAMGTGVGIALVEALALAAAAVYGFTSALTDSQSAMHESAVGTAKTLAVSTAHLTGELTDSTSIFKGTVELLGVAAARWLDWTVAGLAEVAHVVNEFADAMRRAINMITGSGTLNPVSVDDMKAWGQQNTDQRNQDMINNLNPIKAMIGGGAEAPNVPKVPTHTTHIHKVEIKVDSNQDPNRIAKAVQGLLKSDAMYPKSAVLNPASQFSRQ